MGMAASQARLLSITSRMSDNELRSQTINNAKMRLTSESSQVSEEYVAALNQTQFMMKNYSLAGESQYQNLTFNSLTTYSAYNTQYGLRDKSGQLLVSELDSTRYQEALKAADADLSILPEDKEGKNAKALEEFLKSYGLEKASTYFDNADVFKIDKNIQKMYEGDMVFDMDGTRISGMHYGYELSKTSTEYGIFTELLKDYESKSDKYTKAVIKEMHDEVYNTKADGTTSYDDMYKFMTEFEAGYTTVEDEKGNVTVTAPADATAKANRLRDYMIKMLQQMSGHIKDSDLTFIEGMENFLYDTDINGNKTIAGVGNQDVDIIGDAYNRVPMGVIDPVNGWIVYYSDTLPEQVDGDGLPPKDTANPGKYLPTYTKPDGTQGTYKEVIVSTTSQADYCESMMEMMKYFQSNIFGAMKREDFATTGGAAAAQTEFYEASKKLSQFIFGQDVGPKYYDKLNDMEWITGDQVKDPETGLIGKMFPTTALDPSEGGVVVDDESKWVDVPTYVDGKLVNVKYQPNFQAILDVYLCDKMMEQYGAPKQTWIDVKNPKENADAKAQWYTNLFERMQAGGYKTIENGLASSAEWLKFALESSLISMEQVNKDNKWISTMYSNCSDITESSVDLDITRAEAEYNKSMNKIQAKDKRFDLELKNIDTEHQSLQTEYDSVKSVIDKNIERNFKMFSA